MTRLIGFRCTHSNVFSREVLICPVSCVEICVTQDDIFVVCTLVQNKYVFNFNNVSMLTFAREPRNAPTVLVICRRSYTRSHSEHGSQAFLSRWYSARGRVGSRQHRGRVLVCEYTSSHVMAGRVGKKGTTEVVPFLLPSFASNKHTHVLVARLAR